MRIIAGRFKGRKLAAPKRGARPTTDRVKERLFSVLGPFAEDDLVVDLFCGSGALGIEALSRGAAGAVFVDREAVSLEALRRNLAPLRAEAAGLAVTVRRADAAAYVARSWPDGRVSVCFLDPPYGDADGDACLAALGELPPDRIGRIVFEGPDRDLRPPRGLTETRRIVCGETRITIFERGDRE